MEIGVRLMVAADQGEADVICSLLRANGIECGDRHLPEIYAIGSMESPWGGPREILVRQADLEAAREVIAAPES